MATKATFGGRGIDEADTEDCNEGEDVVLDHG